MTAAEYEAGAARARRVMRGRYTAAVVDDAVQAAALYFLEQRPGRVTPSLFAHRAAQRARDLYESAYGSTRPGRRTNEVYVGTTVDLAEFEAGSAVYTVESDAEAD